MYLFVDGARMGYGLGSDKNDLTLCDFAMLSDVFISVAQSVVRSLAKRWL